MRGTFIKLGAFLVASLLCLAWLGNQIGQLTGPAGVFHKTYSVKAQFTDATGLVKGDEVRLAGVRIGKVAGLSVDRGKALVAMSVDHAYKLPADSRFELHWKNLLGQRFVEAVPPDGATLAGAVLKGGTTVGPDRTSNAADLSELLNNTEPLLARLDTNHLNDLMTTVAAAMHGRENELNTAIGNSAQLVDTLSSRADVISKSISEYATLLDGIAGHDVQVRQLLDSLAGTSQTLAQRANDLGDAAGQTGQFSDALAKVLAANEGSLDGVFSDTKTVLDRIVSDKAVLAKALQTLPWTTSAMIRFTSSGDWVNAYVRGAGVIDAYFSEPRIGPDYNNIGPDDPKGGQPILGSPRVPVPPIPTADAGVVGVNPPPGSSPQQSKAGLGTLLAPLMGGGHS
ncbi:MAG: MCE family protein [Acidimicrobiia bacterium]|nr:MCE family protein [Acidimicrobiia bacterium]MBV9042796.1 MCE family protein [Acidimicrobiia bacterium]